MWKVKKICEVTGTRPSKVKGTIDGVQFTKGKSDRVEVISFEEFEAILEKKHLAVYGLSTYMKIMKDVGDKSKQY